MTDLELDSITAILILLGLGVVLGLILKRRPNLNHNKSKIIDIV